MGLKVLPGDELRSLLESIKESHRVLAKLAPHHSLLSRIDDTLADIRTACSQPLPQAGLKVLDDWETELNSLADKSKKCSCPECSKKTEAA